MGKKKIVQIAPFEAIGKKHFFAIAVLGFCIFLVYSNSLNGTWAMDDIVANKSVGIKDIRDLIGFRKVAYISFLLNQWIAPFSPANFRLFNLFIHFLNAVLVYVLAQKTMLFTGLTDKKKVFPAALLGSLIFALHPLNINAVAYIIQRMASLSTFFVLLSILCYIYAAQADTPLKAAMFYLLTGSCVLLGIFSKENAVISIPLIILYSYVFIAKFDNKLFAKKIAPLVGAGIVTLGLAAYLLGFYHSLSGLVGLFGSPTQPLTGRDWMAVDVFWTPLQHVLTELRIISRYLFLVALPLPGFLVFDWWGFSVSTGLLAPLTTLLSLIFLAALLLFSIWKIKRFPLLCFGILWYFIAISLESFFALGADLYFEHRNYLPLTGLIIGVTGQAVMALGNKIKTKTVWGVAVICCVLLGSMTFTRNFVWKDSVTLWEDTLRKAPSNIRAMMSLGNSYLKVSDMKNAEKYYKQALLASSRDKRAHFLNDSAYSLGMSYLFGGKLLPAKELLEKFDYSLESYRPKILRGFYKALNNDIEGALRDYNEIVAETNGIDTVVVLTLTGNAYNSKGLFDMAIEQYSKAIALDSGFSSAYHGLGVSYLGKRNIRLAENYFNRSVSIDPDNFIALSDLADLILIKHDNPAKALAYARKAISKSPSFHQPYLTMGNVLIVLGRENEAGDFYKKAVEREMPEYMVPFSMARAYYIRGDKEKAEYYLARLRGYKGLPENIKNMIR